MGGISKTNQSVLSVQIRHTKESNNMRQWKWTGACEVHKLHFNQSFIESVLTSQNMFLLLENGKNVTYLKQLLKSLDEICLQIPLEAWSLLVLNKTAS